MNETLNWIKSSYSGGSGGNCVEVAVTPDGNRAIRDSKNPDGAILRVPAEAFGQFLRSIKNLPHPAQVRPGFRDSGRFL